MALGLIPQLKKTGFKMNKNKISLRILVAAIIISIGSLNLMACAGINEFGLGRRSANDLNCPESEIHITNIGGDAFQAVGCGWQATYVCGSANFECLVSGRTTSELVASRMGAVVQTPVATPAPSSPQPAAVVPAVDEEVQRNAERHRREEELLRDILDADRARPSTRHGSTPSPLRLPIISVDDLPRPIISVDDLPRPSPTGGCVYVHGYTRANGTYVAPYTRRLRRR
jgi:hypothetical protein